MSSVIVISIMNARPKKKKSKKGAIEKQPDDFEYEVNAFHTTSKSKFKICFSSKDLKIDNIKGWLIEFQINNVTVKTKVKRRQQKAICCRLTTGVNTILEASNFTELSADCVQKIHSMLEAGESPSTARQRFLRELKCPYKGEVAYFPPWQTICCNNIPTTLCEQDSIDRYGWQRPFTKRQVAPATAASTINKGFTSKLVQHCIMVLEISVSIL